MCINSDLIDCVHYDMNVGCPTLTRVDFLQACRGSINLESAELTVPSDDLHFDVTGINGAVYLEAHTLAERQRWVSHCRSIIPVWVDRCSCECETVLRGVLPASLTGHQQLLIVI